MKTNVDTRLTVEEVGIKERCYEPRLDTIGAKSRKLWETSNEMWADDIIKHQFWPPECDLNTAGIRQLQL